MGEELKAVIEDVKPVDEMPVVDEAALADDASDDALEVNPHAAAAPEFDAKTLDLLKKLCEHYGVPHHGDVHATAKALGELTGHSQLGTAALIHELADKSGHR